jgi:hypothetical protein
MLQTRHFLSINLLVTAFLLASVFSFVSAHTAQAATGDLACSTNFQFNFTPALTATQTTAKATATASFTDCTSLNGHYTTLKSASVQATGSVISTGTDPCNLLLTITGTGMITWNNQKTSHLNYKVNTNPLNGTITLSATITGGQLKGDTITALPVVAHPNLDCAKNGLSTLTSEVATLTFA